MQRSEKISAIRGPAVLEKIGVELMVCSSDVGTADDPYPPTFC